MQLGRKEAAASFPDSAGFANAELSSGECWWCWCQVQGRHSHHEALSSSPSTTLHCSSFCWCERLLVCFILEIQSWRCWRSSRDKVSITWCKGGGGLTQFFRLGVPHIDEIVNASFYEVSYWWSWILSQERVQQLALTGPVFQCSAEFLYDHGKVVDATYMKCEGCQFGKCFLWLKV